MKFICDDNLGKLAKYLRILGFDAVFESSFENNTLLAKASSEKRLILTRDHKILSKTHPFGILLLENDFPLEQLRIVINKLKLRIDTSKLFTRCPICNSICITQDKNTLSNKVFPYILKTQNVIKSCPICKRDYWKGTHYKNLLLKLRSVILDEDLIGEWPKTAN